MDTLLLTVDVWDLCLDSGGNIALASRPYALAQDVASAIRLFLGELWYDTTKGVPYFETILGQTPPLSVFQAEMVDAALTVPHVVSAQCVLESFENRTVTGQVLFTDDSGQAQTVTVQ
jgi:hypothetical protein